MKLLILLHCVIVLCLALCTQCSSDACYYDSYLYGSDTSPSPDASTPLTCKTYCASVATNLWQFVYKSGSTGVANGCYCYDTSTSVDKVALPSGASLIGGETSAECSFYDSYRMGTAVDHNDSLTRPLECKAWCETIPGANIYQWINPGFFANTFWTGCYCMYADADATKKTDTKPWGIGGSVDAPPAPAPLPEGCLSESTDYYGSDIKYVMTPTARRCQEACAETDGCVVFTWLSNWHCWLKHAQGTSSSNGDATSGPRSCYESTTAAPAPAPATTAAPAPTTPAAEPYPECKDTVWYCNWLKNSVGACKRSSSYWWQAFRECRRTCGLCGYPCDPNPCTNGGQCVKTGATSHTCDCGAKNTGKSCECTISDDLNTATVPTELCKKKDVCGGFTCDCVEATGDTASCTYCGYAPGLKECTYSCSAALCRFAPTPPINVTWIARGAPMTDEEKAYYVDTHNVLRRNISDGNVAGLPPAKAPGIPDLVWDDDLAATAQRWTDQCIFAHYTGSSVAWPVWVGQNGYWSSGGSSTSMGVGVTKAWYSEVSNYLKGSGVTGHFTQVIWANSKKIGCGYTDCNKNGKHYGTVVFCNYGPGGNFGGQTLYTPAPGTSFTAGKPYSG